MDNLDYQAQLIARNILDGVQEEAEKIENLATKLLGIVQENGIYAGVLFLHTRSSRHDKNMAPAFRDELLKYVSKAFQLPAPANEPRAQLRFTTDQVCAHLGRMILVKSVWEQALIYVRHGAKALKSESVPRQGAARNG